MIHTAHHKNAKRLLDIPNHHYTAANCKCNQIVRWWIGEFGLLNNYNVAISLGVDATIFISHYHPILCVQHLCIYIKHFVGNGSVLIYIAIHIHMQYSLVWKCGDGSTRDLNYVVMPTWTRSKSAWCLCSHTTYYQQWLDLERLGPLICDMRQYQAVELIMF